MLEFALSLARGWTGGLIAAGGLLFGAGFALSIRMPGLFDGRVGNGLLLVGLGLSYGVFGVRVAMAASRYAERPGTDLISRWLIRHFLVILPVSGFSLMVAGIAVALGLIRFTG